jgi:hypothetical protein
LEFKIEQAAETGIAQEHEARTIRILRGGAIARHQSIGYSNAFKGIPDFEGNSGSCIDILYGSIGIHGTVFVQSVIP